MSLLVTLFLSLTTLLVSTVSSSPPVAVGISALTAWIIIQYVFLITAIIAYAFLLAFFRFSDGVDEKKKKVALTNPPKQEADSGLRTNLTLNRTRGRWSFLFCPYSFYQI